MNFNSIPTALRDKPNWVCRRGKIPINPRTGQAAKAGQPDTWARFEEAVQAAPRYDGIGFEFDGSGIIGIDFDHCIENGQLAPWVQDWVSRFDSYTELSPSGTGIHILCQGSLHGRPAVKRKEVEIYDRARYFTMTGRTFGTPRPLRDAQAALDALYEAFGRKDEKPRQAVPVRPLDMDDSTLIKKIEQSAGSARFAPLWRGDTGGYGSHSEADLALCSILAFWTRCNTDQMDRLFRSSGLMRDKWDRRQSGSTYGALTIQKAISQCAQVYEPRRTYPPSAPATLQAAPNKPLSLSVIAARDLQTKDLPTIHFLVSDLLPQGLSLLASPPKYGKSWWVLALCLAVASGEPFMGRQTAQAGCLYLALEDSERRLKFRMNKILRGREAPELLRYATSAHDLSSGLLDELASFLDVYPETRLIVIDTFQKVRAAANGKESAYAADYRESGALKHFADQHGICILLVHHLRKMQAVGDPFERISGTNGILGATDTSMVMTRDTRNDTDTLFSITGRDVDSLDLLISFDKESCIWTVKGAVEQIAAQREEQEYLQNPIVQTIRKLLDQSPDGHWEGTCKDLLEAGKFIAKSYIAPTAQKLGHELKRLELPMFERDGIVHTAGRNGSGGKKHSFVLQDRMQCESWVELSDVDNPFVS